MGEVESRLEELEAGDFCFAGDAEAVVRKRAGVAEGKMETDRGAAGQRRAPRRVRRRRGEGDTQARRGVVTGARRSMVVVRRGEAEKGRENEESSSRRTSKGRVQGVSWGMDRM